MVQMKLIFQNEYTWNTITHSQNFWLTHTFHYVLSNGKAYTGLGCFEDIRLFKASCSCTSGFKCSHSLLTYFYTHFHKASHKTLKNVLYQVCVSRVDWKKKNNMAVLASDWLRHFLLLPCKRWTEFNQTWLEASSQCPLPSLDVWTDRRHFLLLLCNR